jgi:hypothetical protein
VDIKESEKVERIVDCIDVPSQTSFNGIFTRQWLNMTSKSIDAPTQSAMKTTKKNRKRKSLISVQCCRRAKSELK